ncbi:MAG: ADP-ribosylation factor-like protein, partial [Candidatus Njordarchaeota archaeon]
MVIRAVALFDANGNEIFYNTYANFTPNFSLINRVLLGMREHFVKEIDSIDLGQYRVSIMLTSSYFLSILADRVNSQEEISKILEGLIEKAVDIFGEDPSGKKIDQQKIDEFESHVEEAIKMLPVKCTLTGYGGVGKTTIVKLVAKGITVKRHIPTILADVEELRIEEIDPFKVTLFTVAGQPEYWRTWMLTAEGSDFVILITDSSREDVERL